MRSAGAWCHRCLAAIDLPKWCYDLDQAKQDHLSCLTIDAALYAGVGHADGKRSLSNFKKFASAGFSLSSRQLAESPMRARPTPSCNSLWTTPMTFAPREASSVRLIPKSAPIRLFKLSPLMSYDTMLGRSSGDVSFADSSS